MKKIARSILANIFTLLLSLALAILIWVNALRVKDPILPEILAVPIIFTGEPDSSIRINADASPKTVQIKFEGATSIVSQLTADDFTATVDLSVIPFNEETAAPIDVQTSVSDIALLTQSPERISVELEQLVTRDIPVILDIRDDVARGHLQGTPLIDPEAITVAGPASSVEELDFARATVFLNSAKEDAISSRQPIFYDQQGRVASVRDLSLSVEEVNITIPVTESAFYAEKPIDVDVVGSPAPGYRVLDIRVSPLSVGLSGRPTQLEQLDRIQTEPIDITGLTEPYRQQVTLILPEGITQDEAEEIFVDVDIAPFSTTDTYNPTIMVQGLEENLAATVEPETVRVVLLGPLPALEALLDEEVVVTVDLFGLLTGTYSIEPDVSFPDRGIELRSIQPSQVTVNITRLLTVTNEITGALPLTETASLPLFNNFVPNQTVNYDTSFDWSLFLHWLTRTAALPTAVGTTAVAHSHPLKRVPS
ncbi:MAG: hypothetical protein GY803_21765 [Chloroflexi bacterium]|nr:hypothetical protein [Chloroflexota bacterium]